MDVHPSGDVDQAEAANPLMQWENNSLGGAKQPNFLQKLYNFLALDPHPCPEVIYWASDSRQLVIAQPDQLAQEVLPKLYKHDKMASFGRQLNIYGFSRLFPGRQFKDAQGDVSDASVWAHSTLHRSSTMSEIANVKRRAAPKLFRTRRLANGQIVRTKAGPAVEAKAREVRESIAESRRNRGLSFSNSLEDTLTNSPVPFGSAVLPNLHHTPHSPQSTSIWTPLHKSMTLGDNSTRLPGITEGEVAVHPSTPTLNGTFDQSYRRDSAMSIDQTPSSPGYTMTPFTNQTWLTSGVGQDMLYEQSAKQHMFHQMAYIHQSNTNPVNQDLRSNEPVIQMSPGQAGTSTLRQFQSCPASIYTSPVTASMPLGGMGWNNFSVSHKPFQSPAPRVQQVQSEFEQPKIAMPAAPNPFGPIGPSVPQDPDNTPQIMTQLPDTAYYSSYPLTPSSGAASHSQTHTNTPITSTHNNVPNSLDSGFHHIHSSWNSAVDTSRLDGASLGQLLPSAHRMSWEASHNPLSTPGTGTIDPRWVSPISSAWNSLAPTRVPSPVHNIPQTPQSVSRLSIDIDTLHTSPTVQNSFQAISQPMLLQDDSAGTDISYNAAHQPHSAFIHQQAPFALNQGQSQAAVQHQVQTPILGTQSYPPRQAERRQMDVSPPVPLFANTNGSSSHKINDDMGYFGQSSSALNDNPQTDYNLMDEEVVRGLAPGHGGAPVATSLPGYLGGGIGGGKWFH